MQTVLLVIHLIVALALIGIVLLQRSEGGALGIGSGGAGSLFSARGVGNALTRTTAILAVAFFLTSIGLTVLASKHRAGGSIFDQVPAQQTPSQPGDSTKSGGGSSVLPQLPPSKNSNQQQVPVSP